MDRSPYHIPGDYVPHNRLCLKKLSQTEWLLVHDGEPRFTFKIVGPLRFLGETAFDWYTYQSPIVRQRFNELVARVTQG